MIFRLEILTSIVLLVATALAIGAGIARRREVRRPGVVLDLMAPEGDQVDLSAWLHLFQSLYGISRPWWKRCLVGQPWLAFELRAKDGLVWARCWCPEQIEGMVSAHLRETVPGIQVREAEGDDMGTAPAARTRLNLALEPIHSLGATKPDAMARITGLLSGTQDALVQVVITPDVTWQRRAERRLDQLAGANSWGSVPLRFMSGLMDEVFGIFWPNGGASPRKRPTSPPRRGAQVPAADKATQPGWAAEIRLRVAGKTQAEANLQMQSLVSAFRALDGANALRPAWVLMGSRFDRDLIARRAPRTHGMALVAPELACLFHLPCAGSALTVAPVRVAAGRVIGPGDKVICLPEDGAGPPMGIRQADCRQHLHILGPTGSGKSTLLLNLALDDILAGRGVGVIDPKGDLIQALLERIPRSEWERVVLIDPAQRELPVGLNVLACDDPDQREVVCDQVVTIFHKSFERFWGPRTDDLLRAAILTLLEKPGTTLCEVPLLLLQPEMRQKFIADLDDPVGLEPFWKEFGGMTDGQRLQVIGPLLNKLRTFLLRRTVRNMLGQSQSTVGVGELLDNNCIVLISLAKGLLGEETSQLLGAFLFARIWQATLARGGRPESWRPDFNLYVDEFQNYLHLPQSIEDVLAEARGYHLGLVLANQHIAQLGASAREALAANARTRVSFQCGQDDARYLAREFSPQLCESDLRGLRQFQVAVRLCVNGRTEPAFTGVTRGLPPSLGEDNAACLTRHALQRWGRPRPVVEAEIRSRLDSEGFSNPDEGLGD